MPLLTQALPSNETNRVLVFQDFLDVVNSNDQSDTSSFDI